MKRHLAVGLILIGLLGLPGAALAAPPSHPDLAGTWYTIDCAQWWEGGVPVDCSVWGDGSTIYLTIGPGNAPVAWLYDTYAQVCEDNGEPPYWIALGMGSWEVDEPSNRTLNIGFRLAGCGTLEKDNSYTIGLYWDPGSDTMWNDPDGDGWGLTWRRVP